jgi:thioredoxin reductase (NADPH)
MKYFDVVILGGGPAGLTAAIDCARSKMSTLCIEKRVAGGQAAVTANIENYPGFPGGVAGAELGAVMKEQAEKFGAVLVSAAVETVDLSGNEKTIDPNKPSYTCKPVVIPTGADPAVLAAPGRPRTGAWASPTAPPATARFSRRRTSSWPAAAMPPWKKPYISPATPTA